MHHNGKLHPNIRITYIQPYTLPTILRVIIKGYVKNLQFVPLCKEITDFKAKCQAIKSLSFERTKCA
jgi:hypothetical protein